MKNLIEHAPALGDAGIGATVLTEGLEEHFHIVGLDVSELAHPEIVLQNAQGVAVVFLGGCGDVVLMVFKPDVRPVAEGVVAGGIDARGTIVQKLLQLFSGFLLGFSVDGFVVGFAVGLIADHNAAFPASVISLASHTLAVGSFCHVTPSSGNKGASHL